LHVVLIGLMASGKTTLGRALATRTDRPFVDNDEQLRARTGQTAREIALADGADVLHRREAEALVEALASSVPAVVAAAAAAPLEPDAANAMRLHVVVYLRARPDVLAARLAGVPVHDDHRPFVDADARAVLEAQFAERDAAYVALANLSVDVSRGDPREILDEIVTAITPELAR
jgi:shikimate kinase